MITLLCSLISNNLIMPIDKAGTTPDDKTEQPTPFDCKYNDFSHYNETPAWVDKVENRIKRILTPVFKKLKLDKHL